MNGKFLQGRGSSFFLTAWRPTRLALGLLCSLCVLFAPSSFAAEVYRYINEKGVQVIEDRVPPEFVSKGYDVLDSKSLTLIRRVPRQLTEEELKLRNTDEAKDRLRQEEEQRLRAWDESLMMRYSNIADIEAAKKRAIQDLKIRISIQKSNLHSLKSQIENEQQKAANIERRGVNVPDEMLNNIETMRREIEDIEQSIAVRREEIASVEASYDRDIKRFETLLDRVEMRRRSATSIKRESKKNNFYH